MATEEETKLLALMKGFEECPVRGHIKYLDKTRLVFVGQDPAKPNTWYLGFRNQYGNDTQLALSQEAYNALKWLMTEPFKGERVGFPYKITAHWEVEIKVVENDKSDA